MVGSSEMRTEVAVDRSGWMTSRVLDVKQTSRSVDIEDGEDTTVVTLKTSQYRVNPEVRNFSHCSCILCSVVLASLAECT